MSTSLTLTETPIFSKREKINAHEALAAYITQFERRMPPTTEDQKKIDDAIAAFDARYGA